MKWNPLNFLRKKNSPEPEAKETLYYAVPQVLKEQIQQELEEEYRRDGTWREPLPHDSRLRLTTQEITGRIDYENIRKSVESTTSFDNLREFLLGLIRLDQTHGYPFYDDTNEDEERGYRRKIWPSEIVSAMSAYLDSGMTDMRAIENIPSICGLREHFLKLYPPGKGQN